MSNWSQYFCNVNDKLSSILVDLDLKDLLPDHSRTDLIWIWIYMNSPRPDGLSSNEEFETLNMIEDALTKHLETYGPDGSLQKTGTISAEHRLVDEVVLNTDGSTKKESNAADLLDAHGNWTKLTKWRTDSQGTRPISVAYRTLTYY